MPRSIARKLTRMNMLVSGSALFLATLAFGAHDFGTFRNALVRNLSIQAQIVNLLVELQKQFNLTYLFISHDLSMVRHICDRVAVMYLGVIVEIANKNDFYHHPLHPYTRALLSAVAIPDPFVEEQRKRTILKGEIPSPINPPSGCRFRTRCPIAQPQCAESQPELRELRPGHFVACFLATAQDTSAQV